MITTLPGAHDMKPGSAGRPFFGIVPELVDADGKVLEGAASGNLCIARSWPGQMRTVYGDHERFVQTYFSAYQGKYFTGDGCRRDEDGYYWITGRVDDVLNISGHRLGTAEIESALVSHPLVAEAAVVGYPHDIKGQGIYCYVTLIAGDEPSDALEAELKRAGPHRDQPDRDARPDPLHPGSAQDPLGQDHAPDPAEDRRERLWRARRHLDAGRSGLVDDLIEGRRNRVMQIVAADIGGTHARFALAELRPGERPRLGEMRKYRTRDMRGPRRGLGAVRARQRRRPAPRRRARGRRADRGRHAHLHELGLADRPARPRRPSSASTG